MADTATELVLQRIRATECVPMLAGHGVLLPGVRVPDLDAQRQACARCRSLPGHKVRAYLMLAFLGKGSPSAADGSYWGQGGEKYFGGSFLDGCFGWFEQRRTELRLAGADAALLAAWDAMPVRHRWKPMLEALASLAESAPGLSQAQRDRVRGEWLEHARQRLTELVKKRRGKVQRPALAPRSGVAVRAADPRWKLASTLLARDDSTAALLQGAYLLHVFHACLALWQLDLSDGGAAINPRQRRRLLFHQALLRLLNQGCLTPPLRAAADRIVPALAQTPLFDERGHAKAPGLTPALLQALPPCFAAYRGGGPVLFADSASQAEGESALERLAAAHQLGEMLADQLLDCLRVRRAADAAPGFGQDHYRYAISRLRYVRHHQATQGQADAPAAQGAACMADPACVDCLACDPADQAREADLSHLLQAYFEHLCGTRVPHLLAEHLGEVYQADWRDATRPCAMCHVQTPPKDPT